MNVVKFHVDFQSSLMTTPTNFITNASITNLQHKRVLKDYSFSFGSLTMNPLRLICSEF